MQRHTVKKTQTMGQCLCGAVRYSVAGPLREVVNCHCGQCRRFHGHFAAYTQANLDDVTIVGDGEVTWYQSSDQAERGFCQICGSSLFFRRFGADRLSIAAGTLNSPTRLKTARHIFTASAGDYYEMEDQLEKLEGYYTTAALTGKCTP